MSDTIAAIATGNRVSAIGIVRLSGQDAISAVGKLFAPSDGRPMEEHESRKLVFGELKNCRGELLDLCLCTISRAPNTYTGEDTAEFQCHGSPIVLRTVLEELFSLGIRQAGPGEFTKRAFLNGKMSLTSAEAVADLIDAENTESALNAAGQLSGTINRKTDRIYQALTDICSHFHAVLDYPDEDIEDFQLEAYQNVLADAIRDFERLMATFERGKHMNAGIPTAIVGKPNAGKSSLLNALLGYDRAIVTSVPGTTRDTIEEKVNLGNTCLRLIDTAGIRSAEDEAERLGVERSRDALSRAELAIVVMDGSRPITAEDEEILTEAKERTKTIVVISKKDRKDFQFPKRNFGCETIAVSSVESDGTRALEKAIQEMFPIPDVPAGEILTNTRQAQAIAEALEYLRSAEHAMAAGNTPDIVLTEVEGAMNAIGELNGRTVREDVTNRIFQRFCVGK